jgi:hypothetical protein
MRALSSISKFFMWAFLIVYSVFQLLAVLGIMGSNQTAIEAGQADKAVSYIPLVVATLLMIIGVVLFTVLKKLRYIGILISVVAAVVMLMVALELGRLYPPSIGTTGTVGLTTWKLIWRHIGISAVPLFMLIAWLADRQITKSYSLERKIGYNLSGEPLFKGLDDENQTEISPVKPKRSIKDRIRKQNPTQ